MKQRTAAIAALLLGGLLGAPRLGWGVGARASGSTSIRALWEGGR
jgi:hypothetical protein